MFSSLVAEQWPLGSARDSSLVCLLGDRAGATFGSPTFPPTELEVTDEQDMAHGTEGQ
jgi:hypothetical protein